MVRDPDCDTGQTSGPAPMIAALPGSPGVRTKTTGRPWCAGHTGTTAAGHGSCEGGGVVGLRRIPAVPVDPVGAPVPGKLVG